MGAYFSQSGSPIYSGAGAYFSQSGSPIYSGAGATTCASEDCMGKPEARKAALITMILGGLAVGYLMHKTK